MQKQKIIKRILIIATFIAAFSLINISTTFGTAQITLTVKNPNPMDGNYSWFVYNNKAGETINDIATVKNFSNEPTNVKVYAVDAMSSESGSFILSFENEEQNGIGVWTDVKSKTITIPPFEVIDIPFNIQIPNDAPPGQYLGGIVVENGINSDSDTSSADKSNGTNISVKTRIGSRVYLTIPGEIKEDLQFPEFRAEKTLTGATKLFLTLENNGNISYEPTAHIEIYNQSGELFETIEKELGTIAPNTTIKPVLEMEKRPIIGNFTIKAVVTFKCKFAPENLHGSAHSLNGETTFWAMPWEIILSALFLIFIILSIITNRKLAKKRYFANGEEYEIAPQENLIIIGKNRNISWKKIAHYNKLKAPYVVKPGDKIIVPKNNL